MAAARRRRGWKVGMRKTVVFGTISIYSMAHALVDAACVATLFSILPSSSADRPQVLFQSILVYNVIAFSTQPVIGILADYFKKPAFWAVAGILLVAAATLLLQAPLWAAVFAGLGNALFHIGGGITSLNLARGRAALPGIFVAPGALGVAAGLWIGKGGYFTAWPFILLLAVSAVIILMLPGTQPAVKKFSGSLKWFEAVILFLLVSVAIRSLVGMSLVFPWKSDPLLLAGLTAAVVLGKALGGILGDRFGWIAVAVSGLVLSAPMLAFFPQIPLVAIAGIFLFNLSMQITLIGVAGMLPANHGFAFGLTTLALIIGAGPAFTPLHELANPPWIIFASILVSIAALHGGLRLYAAHFGDIIPTHPTRLPTDENPIRRSR
jgi:FSR family fosmidomycin resistance protein-like MFS transporter